VLFAPDKEGVEEITFSHAILPPNGRTDYHRHDRPELIYVVSGKGICVHEGEETPVARGCRTLGPDRRATSDDQHR